MGNYGRVAGDEGAGERWESSCQAAFSIGDKKNPKLLLCPQAQRNLRSSHNSNVKQNYTSRKYRKIFSVGEHSEQASKPCSHKEGHHSPQQHRLRKEPRGFPRQGAGDRPARQCNPGHPPTQQPSHTRKRRPTAPQGLGAHQPLPTFHTTVKQGSRARSQNPGLTGPSRAATSLALHLSAPHLGNGQQLHLLWAMTASSDSEALRTGLARSTWDEAC